MKWFVLVAVLWQLHVVLAEAERLNAPAPILTQMQKRDIAIEWMRNETHRYVLCNMPMDGMTK